MSLPVDLSLGWRGFRSHPWVSVVAIVTLALGIAGATTMFTMLTAIGTIMVPPGVDAARVGRVAWTSAAESGARAPLAGEEFRQLAAARTVFETVSASVDERLVLGGEGGPSVAVKRVSADFFRTFGFEPSAGRLFSAAEGRHGEARVAIVSEGLTRRVPGLGVGGVVRLGNSDHAIVGVLPNRCWFPTPDGTDVWLPLEIDPNGVPAARSVTVTVRLRSAGDFALAQAQVEAVGSRLEPDAAATPGRRLRVITLEEDVGKRMGFGLAGFIGPSIVVLLIACGNVANLLLAGAARRERDAAVRAALGASRFRLIKERLSESAGLGVAGGVLGIGLAVMGVWLLRLWVGSFESAASAAERIRLNGPSLLFALVLTLATPLIFGLVPAWAASKPNLVQALHQAPGRRRPRRGPYGGGDLLVIVEVGLAVVLVVAAGMFSRFFADVGRLDWGFDPTKVIAVELSRGPDARQDARGTRLAADIADAVRAVPGVGAVAAGDLLGLRVRSDRDPIEFEGCAATGGPGGTVALRVGPDYFATLGLPVRRGRAFSEQDVAGSPAVGLVSERHARRCWPGQDPIGKRFRPARGASTPWVTVVGVAGDTMVSRALDGPQPVYLAMAQGGDGPGTLLVRAAGDPLALVGPVRAAVRRIDPTQPLDRVERLDDGLRRQLGETSMLTGLIGGFGLFALFLGALGVFSVVSHMVAERTREFGIRIALGATVANVLRLVFGRAALIVGIGAGVSIAGTLVLARAAFREMAALAATDVVLWASVCGLLVVTALGASLVPARRATRVEPVRALRAE